ncbi:MAG: nitroreductase family deazaflavin-dependent oxidoreductase [Chloroflexales bacterium]|nr:nitroreductase family deazaflavin-dependent oxidoreductase [Chloroflexales bacterium]
MSSRTVTKSLPRGLLRLFLRLPLWLYRFRMGWLLGTRFVMLSHIGRKSRRLRQTVLEVVVAQAAPPRYVVAAGWGRQSDWFRNVQQTPRVLLDTAKGRFAAVAQTLDEEAATAALHTYAQAHPTAFRNLSRVMIGEALTASLSDCRKLAQQIPLVALDVQS